jgi:hypothetical protein
MGAGISYLVGPLAVPYDTGSSSVEQTQKDIRFYLVGLAATAALIFLG